MGVMALPPSSKYLQRRADPVDDVERESLTQRLNGAFADGRISHDQYAEAMDTLYAARSLGDLVPVVEKLPAAAENAPAIVERGTLPAGQVTQARDLAPLGLLVGAVGVVLVAALAILLVILFF